MGGKDASLRGRGASKTAIVRSATELSTQEPSDAPLAQGRPGIEPGTIRKLRQKGGGARAGARWWCLTTVGFEPTPEDQCLKLAP